MRTTTITLLLASSAALAFTPTHLVIVEGAVLYDEDHNYEDYYIIERLPYWTPVVAEEVGSPLSPRTYCLVTLADGRRGLAEWDYLGRAYDVAAEETILVGVPAVARTERARLKRGEVVAETGPPATDDAGNVTWRQVTTAEGQRGWLSAPALAPLGD
ncbi:MAG: hypothetical protein V3W11_06005 [bacterium]